MALKDKLAALFRQGRKDLDELAAGLTPEQREKAGTLDDWSIKDILGHLAHWQRVACQDLAGVPREPVSEENINALNAVIYEERRGRSWDHIWADLMASSDELLQRVEAMSEDELEAADPNAWQRGRPAWRALLGNGYSHSLIHLTNWYAQNGQQERGLALMVKGMGMMKGLDASPDWQGTCLYNIACQHALSGDKQSALPALAEALRLNPGLKAWSRQDADLACLRGEEAYEALYPLGEAD